ncbi:MULTISPECIES: hypothetical protein [unclassified Shewanella]|uniref:hypothetical protein n=1 Tax=unclassified Shewanella TaxID=196818 RepID=UPI001BBDC70F|nr:MULTISPECIES: hypothetical protein [unclassified Shewanella]GIU09190.1 hypothetical protein TUM4444_11480 [Shewanella sp. MBTL60-112-B1]GIU29061.1 hypothetical protein TUM4445_10930 [Shewanella sp. MBTL60-112-B2]
MDIREATKRATSLFKERKLDDAVELLKSVVPEMAKVGGFTKGDYTKIIPYFQKAGRYQESVEYSENVLVPAIEEDCRRTFNHKCREIQQAFQSLGISEVYDKLRLCAKREKIPSDESKYGKLSIEAYERYTELLETGEKIELKKEYNENLTIFGSVTGKWPRGLLKRFDSLINT